MLDKLVSFFDRLFLLQTLGRRLELETAVARGVLLDDKLKFFVVLRAVGLLLDEVGLGFKIGGHPAAIVVQDVGMAEVDEEPALGEDLLEGLGGFPPQLTRSDFYSLESVEFLVSLVSDLADGRKTTRAHLP